MKRYCIKCRAGRIEFFDILAENDEELRIRHTRLSDGNEKTVEEAISRSLFDICVKTGYIYELEKTNELPAGPKGSGSKNRVSGERVLTVA